MDMSNAWAGQQQWLLDSGDGSQVICLCQDLNSQVEDNIRHDDEVVSVIDVSTHTTPLKRSSPFIPNVRKQKLAKRESSVWTLTGSDIRRNFSIFKICK